MRITIICGFFLPVPPLGGGATEKTWFRLAGEFAAQGHEVTMFSRRWSGLPDTEIIAGVRHVRLAGHNHHRLLWRNLLQDFIWSLRIFLALPPAEIVVCHAVTLPIWLGLLRPSAGKVVVMCGRMPKGQYRRYRRLARILSPSNEVKSRLIAENHSTAALIQTVGYPIDWSRLSDESHTAPPFLPQRSDSGEVTIGFVGRLHEEKGLHLLAQALSLLRDSEGLPPWRVILCGPSDTARGGSGSDFRARLFNQFSKSVDLSRLHVLDPQFNDKVLASIYQHIDIFCYPSLAEDGETFGVGVVEAMAAGAIPVVSQLACFRDFVRPDENGLIFDHRAPDAAAQLSERIKRLLQDSTMRQRLATQARLDTQRYDYRFFAEQLLLDFAQLAGQK